MVKKVLQVLLLLFSIAPTVRAQDNCPGKATSITPFFAGYPDRDSLLVSEMLAAGKLSTKFSGLEVTDFRIGTGDGNCVGGTGLYVETNCNSNQLTSEAAALLKRGSRGQKFFLSHVHVRNKAGQRFCIEKTPIYILDYPDMARLQIYVAGYPDSTKLSASEILEGGRLETNAKGYEISGFNTWSSSAMCW